MDEKFDIVADLLRSFKALIDWCIFILLSRKSDGALCFALIHTCLGVDHFPSFSFSKLSDKIRVSLNLNRLFQLFQRLSPFPTFPSYRHSPILLLVRSHQAKMIIVKRLIQERNSFKAFNRRMRYRRVYAHWWRKQRKVILDGVNEVLETMQIIPENAEDESNHTIAAACTPLPEPTKTMSISCGFENMYEKVLQVQDHC